MPEPKYPHVKLNLLGEDGNAFAIMGRLRGALRSAKVPNSEIKEVIEECTRGDYNHLLRTVMLTVDTSGDDSIDEEYDDYTDEPETCDQ